MNWRWPAKPGNNFRPGYVILWRLLWVPPFYVGKAITWISIAAVDGPREANDWWERQSWV